MGKTLSYAFELTGAIAGSFKGAVTSARSQIAGLGADVRAMEKSATGNLGASFAASSQKLAGLSAELKSARATLTALKTQAAAAGGANDILARQIAQAEKRVSSLTSANKRAVESHRNLAASITTEAGSVGTLMKEYAGLSAQMEKTRARQKALSANLAARDANKARRGELRAGMFDTVALAASVALPVKMAMDFESGMADAAKTIEGMRDESGKLTPMYYAMVTEAKKLGRELPIAHSEIATLMGAAGQLGLTDAKEIATFTKDAAQMSVAFGTSLDAAADAIGGYRTALGLSQDQVREMLDLMNYYANTGSASEGGIAEIVRRVGALGDVAGLAHKPMVALAATLDSLKVKPEVAATSIKGLLLALNAGTRATKSQDFVLNKLGLDAVKLAKRMQNDATGATLDFLKAVQKLPKHEQISSLSAFVGKQNVESIAPLLKELDLLNENFALVGDQAKYLGSMQKEFANRSATTAGALQLTKNKVSELSITIGSVLLPPFNTVLGVVGDGASALADLSERFPVATKVIGSTAAATVSLAVASKALAYGYTFVKGGLLLAEGALLRMTGAQVANEAVTKKSIFAQKLFRGASIATSAAVKGVAVATRAMSAALMANPVGLIIGGIALAAAAVIANWDQVCGYFNAKFSAVKAAFDEGWVNGIFKTIAEFNPIRLVADGLSGMVNYVTGWNVDLWDAFTTVWGGIGAFYSGKIDTVVEAFRGGFLGGIGAILSEFNPLAMVWDGMNAFTSFLAEKFAWVESGLQSISSGWNSVKSVFGFGDDGTKVKDNPPPAITPQPAASPHAAGLDNPVVEQPRAAQPAGVSQTTPAFYTPPAQSRQQSGSAKGQPVPVSVEMPMTFDVKGLDEAEFRKKVEGCRPQIEEYMQRLVKRIVTEMEHNQARVRFAQ